MNKKPTAKKIRARDKGEVRYISAEIDSDLAQVMDSYIDIHGSTKRFIVERGVQLFLESKGMWPVKVSNK